MENINESISAQMKYCKKEIYDIIILVPYEQEYR